MADSDKELGAIQALRKIECKHTPYSNKPEIAELAGVVESVMNNQDADFSSKM